MSDQQPKAHKITGTKIAITLLLIFNLACIGFIGYTNVNKYIIRPREQAAQEQELLEQEEALKNSGELVIDKSQLDQTTIDGIDIISILEKYTPNLQYDLEYGLTQYGDKNYGYTLYLITQSIHPEYEDICLLSGEDYRDCAIISNAQLINVSEQLFHLSESIPEGDYAYGSNNTIYRLRNNTLTVLRGNEAEDNESQLPIDFIKNNTIRDFVTIKDIKQNQDNHDFMVNIEYRQPERKGNYKLYFVPNQSRSPVLESVEKI